MIRRWIILTFLLAIVVRFPLINGSFWLDEAAQVLESQRSFSEQLQIGYDFQPPLLHVIVWGLVRISTNEAFLRSVSLLAGVGSIFFTYLIAQTHAPKNSRVSLLVVALITFSQFHIFYSQELRSYMLATFFGSVSWWLVVTQPFSLRVRSLFLAGVHLLGLYSMYVYPFLIISQLIFVLFSTMKKKWYLISILLSAIGFIPWLPSFLNQVREGTTLSATLSGWSQVVSLPQWKSLAMSFAKLITGQIPYDGLYALISGGMVLLFGFGLFLVLRTQKQLRLFFVCSAVLPVVLAWLVSFFVPVLAPKRVLFVLPFLFMMFAFLGKKFGRVSNGILGVFITLQVFVLFSYWSDTSLQREDWRTVSREIYEQYDPSETLLIFGFTDAFAPWRFYDQQQEVPFDEVAFSTIPISAEEVQQLDQKVRTYQTVIIFDYLRDLTDPNRMIEKKLEQLGYIGEKSIPYQHIGFLRVYQKIVYQANSRVE